MRKTGNIALRPYLESIRQACAPLVKDELREMIMSMLREVPAAERTAFIKRIESLRPDTRKTEPEKKSTRSK